jgi:hypothetical protein
MYERRFSKWHAWNGRDDHPDCGSPGVYVVAITRRRIGGRPFAWSTDVIYIGMTNSVGGLKARLRQFDQTMVGTLRHGGADRVRFKYRSYSGFVKKAYVAVAAFKCQPESASARDLRIMGDVARFEYRCLSHFVYRFGRLPAFNDRSAPKFSQRVAPTKVGRRAS